MFELTHTKDKVNGGMALGGLIAAAVPIVAVAATGGLAAVPLVLWVGLGGAVSTLLAGNVKRKSKVERALDVDAARNGGDRG